MKRFDYYEETKKWLPIEEGAVKSGDKELDDIIKKYLQKFGNAMSSDMKELKSSGKYDKIKDVIIELAKEVKETFEEMPPQTKKVGNRMLPK